MSTKMTPAGQTRRRSRSNSTSSSLLTVKKSASLSSRSNPRASLLRTRQASPDPVPVERDFLHPRSLSRRRGSSEDGKSVHNRNINRWSHSTSSSVSAIDTDAVTRGLQGTSGRLSVEPGYSTNGGTANYGPQKSRESSQNRLVKKVDSRQQSPVSKRLGAGQLYQQAGRSPNASTTSLTPTSMYNRNVGDYFGETWHHRKQSNKFGEPVAAMSVQYMTTSQQRPRRIDDVSPQKLSASQHIASQTPEETSQQRAIAQGTEHRRSRGHRSPTQKTMLSKALAQANAAVLLDNASNIEGAIEAYADACELLEQVMIRSSDGDDRKKLSAIRSTYSNRIAELHDLDDTFANLMNKELPEDPPVEELNGTFFGSPDEPTAADVLEQVQIPPRQESLLPQLFGGERYLQDPTGYSRPKPAPLDNLIVPMDSRYAPPPLSPRRPPSPSSAATTITPVASKPDVVMAHHIREDSTESTSWLDTIDDAESSHSSSRLSMLGFERTSHSNNMMDEIEAQFDAALTAAVDAAYESDLEPEDTPKRDDKSAKVATDQPQTREHAHLHGPQQTSSHKQTDSLGREYLDEDTTEEEERLLDEMTQGYVFDDFHFDNKSKSALPRQSDSSTLSNRTFSSSVPSTTLTSGTTLSTLAEAFEPPKPPPTREIPPLPPAQSVESSELVPKAALASTSPTSPPRSERFSGINLRDRRLSGQSARQLKIETFAPVRGTSQSAQKNLPTVPKIEIPPAEPQKGPHTAPLYPVNGPPSSNTPVTLPMTPMTSVHSGDSQTSESPATPALTQSGSVEEIAPPPASPSRPGKMMPPPAPMRKNLSSSSLRMRNLSSVTNDDSPITPGSAQFPLDAKKGAPPLPTPTNTSFTHHPTPSGGMFLFDDHIGTPTSPKTPRTPNAVGVSGPPAPLESCPDSFLLRPWWLMRCLYSVISHPRGGYISTKLFIPRDIWKVKNVKLKFLDDKVSQCDLLTAALLKLAKVDQLDADAVLEELQSFETVLDQVRGVLQKKLGGEVGLSSSTNVFKSPVEEPEGKPAGIGPAKNSFASSWRKLRSKSSNAAIPGNPVTSKGDASTAGLTMPSLPMTSSTSVPTSRSYTRRNIAAPPTPTQLTNIPMPHATYMSSLARLFDAVQVLDAIARQVEDPGLKCSNKTQVGLELGVRGAAEFFAFFILRFVMSDVGVLIDKFLKRGTEWVLA